MNLFNWIEGYKNIKNKNFKGKNEKLVKFWPQRFNNMLDLGLTRINPMTHLR